jgi:hypothetical protein
VVAEGEIPDTPWYLLRECCDYRWYLGPIPQQPPGPLWYIYGARAGPGHWVFETSWYPPWWGPTQSQTSDDQLWIVPKSSTPVFASYILALIIDATCSRHYSHPEHRFPLLINVRLTSHSLSPTTSTLFHSFLTFSFCFFWYITLICIYTVLMNSYFRFYTYN